MNTLTKIGIASGIAAVATSIVIAVYPEARRGNELSFWLWIGLAISVSLHVFSLPTGSTQVGPVETLNELVERLKRDVSPPTLAFLALAEEFNHPQFYGRRLANAKPEWARPDDEWYKRANMLTGHELLIRSGSEYARSDLGSLYVFLALKKPHYKDALNVLKAQNWSPL